MKKPMMQHRYFPQVALAHLISFGIGIWGIFFREPVNPTFESEMNFVIWWIMTMLAVALVVAITFVITLAKNLPWYSRIGAFLLSCLGQLMLHVILYVILSI